MKTKTTQTIRKVTRNFAALLALVAAPSAFAANQIWTNAPVDRNWLNTNNWVARGIPGALNSSTVADVATFNAPLPLSGIGGVANPITNDFTRGIRGLFFDTVGCGAYVLGGSISDTSLEIMHSGNITVGVAVTNPITINQPLRVRIPSSTNARYDFTNSAVNPNAFLFVNVISNTSASTRPLTMFLAGDNAGTNTIARIDDNAGANGAIQIDKEGLGTWILSGPNELPQKTSAGNIARVAVNAGTLIVKDVASLGSISAANLFVTNTGVLQIDNTSPQNLGIGLRKGGTIRMNGTGTINGLVVGNQATTTAALATTSASDVFTVGSASVVSGGAVDTVVNVNGPGTVQLSTVNTYVGKWSFNSGTNQLINSSGLGTGANANIAAGAILDASAIGFYSLTTAGISANGTGTAVGSTAATITAGSGGTFDLGSKAITLTFTPTVFSGDTTHPALYVSAGSLSLNGNAITINNASGTPLGAGTYRLIQQASGVVTVAAGPFAVVTGSGLAAGHIGDIQVSGGFVNLVVSAHVPVNLTWQGGNPNSDWDNLTTANWFNGVGLVQFGNSDVVTFNATGIANPTVNIASTVVPSSIKVDTTSGDYTLGGAGQIAGLATLTKIGANAVVLQTANAYQGGTVISNGTLRVGIDNAIPSAGAGNVSLYTPGVLDVNNFSDTINALVGDGTVDNLGGGAGTLSVGANNNSGTFSGIVKNTSGSTTLRKVGNGTLTLTASNTHTGGTIIEAGTLRVDNYNGLAGGAVTNNGGTLNITTNMLIGGLSGTGGTVNNNSALTPTVITLQGVGEYTGVIGNGPVGSGISLFIKSGTTRLNGVNTYSNGTVVATGATLALGVINPGASGQLGTGGIITSNGATISLPSNVSVSSQLGNNITNIDAGGTVFFNSPGQANSFNGLFAGNASNTNVYSGAMTIGGTTSFSNFLGTAIISNACSFRFLNANCGGDNTIFEINGNVFTRDNVVVRLGAVVGNGSIGGPSGAINTTFYIGAKGISTVFPGAVAGSNSIVKVGAGIWTLNGVAASTNTVTLPDPFEPTNIVAYTLSAGRVSYVGSTTISNGTLKVVAPNNLTNSSSITLAGATAVLDATQIGYITNQTVIDYNSLEQTTNTTVVTSGVVQILTGQSLNGFGSISGSVSADLGSTISPGLPIGTLNVSGNLAINGTVNSDLNRTNLAQNCDRIAAGSFTGSGATLNVTNVGPTLVSGTTFQLFNGAVSAFSTVNLPATSADGTIAYTWQNNLAVNGSITLLTGLSAAPTTLTSVVTGSTLNLSWPADHKGWTLQSQTNALTVGISTNWSPVANSTLTNQVFVPVVSTNQTVFYRLTLPLP